MKLELSKIDTDQMLVYGFANVSATADGEVVTDLHDDVIPASVLEKAAHTFVLKYRDGGVEHDVMGVARLVESCFLTPEKLQAMGLSDDTFKGAAWFLGFKVDDPDVWRRVKAGELSAFSIGGTGTYEELE